MQLLQIKQYQKTLDNPPPTAAGAFKQTERRQRLEITIVVLVLIVVILTIKLFLKKISLEILAYYVSKNYRLPTDEELEACRDEWSKIVIKKILRED